MNSSPLHLMFAWCLLGYMFLFQNEPIGAILASMAAITTSSLAQRAGFN